MFENRFPSMWISAPVFYAILLSMGGCAVAAPRTGATPEVRLGVWDIDSLNRAHDDYAKDPASEPALTYLLKNITKDMGEPIHSVMDKTVIPPSGDKHDYMSISQYWWPDPSQPNGIPYMVRDGEVNPQNNIDTPDRINIETMGRVVKDLSLGYYITGNKANGERAAKWIRTWFVDPETRMNPNMEYAAGVPGRYDGHPTGCIEIHFLAEMLDAVELLHTRGALSKADMYAFNDWSVQFLQWLLTSKKGTVIARGNQNISTWYDTEVVSLALFTGNEAVAKKQCELAEKRRIDVQIAPDGTLPAELKRTASLGYSIFDLIALCELAQLSDRAGVDLWSYESAEGASLRKSIDFHLPYLYRQTPWPYRQIHEFKPVQGFAVVYQIAGKYGAGTYAPYLDETKDPAFANDISNLIYPKPQ